MVAARARSSCTTRPRPLVSAAHGHTRRRDGLLRRLSRADDPGCRHRRIATQGVKWLRLGENWSQVAQSPSAPGTWNWTDDTGGRSGLRTARGSRARRRPEGARGCRRSTVVGRRPGGLHYPSMTRPDYLHDQVALRRLGDRRLGELHPRIDPERRRRDRGRATSRTSIRNEADNIAKQVTLQRFTYDTVRAYEAAHPGRDYPVVSGALAGVGWATSARQLLHAEPQQPRRPRSTT